MPVPQTHPPASSASVTHAYIPNPPPLPPPSPPKLDRRYGAYIFVAGFVGKQVVWEIAQRNIKEIHEKQHKEAAEALEQAYADGRRLAAMKRAMILAEIAENEAKEKAAGGVKR